MQLRLLQGHDLRTAPVRDRVRRRPDCGSPARAGSSSRDTSHPEVVYEPGKCILCGACVAVAARAGDGLGLAIVGRGFDAAVAVPLQGDADRGAAERRAPGRGRLPDRCVRAEGLGLRDAPVAPLPQAPAPVIPLRPVR